MDLSAYSLETLHQDTEFVLYARSRGRQSGTGSDLSPRIRADVGASSAQTDADAGTRIEPCGPSSILRGLCGRSPLAHHQGRAALILEDQQGEPLERLLEQAARQPRVGADRSTEGALELSLFLRLAGGLAAAVGEMHRRGIVHKNIKPAHVLVNAATGQVWLTGFGIASRLPRERQTPEPLETIAGTLAYMAPEQTGRMNRSIDGRSDLYALGVTLYQLLTGSLPFTAADPIEWVHCHVARQPVPPSERVADVPAPVSAIVMKLLAKAPEERYQTAAGLERDLRRCQAAMGGRIDGSTTFRIGERDTPDRLLIPEKLYGRQREVETLLAVLRSRRQRRRAGAGAWSRAIPASESHRS